MPWVLLAANQSSRSSATAVGVPTNVRERPSPDLGAKASRNVHALSAAASMDSSERFESVSWVPDDGVEVLRREVDAGAGRIVGQCPPTLKYD